MNKKLKDIEEKIEAICEYLEIDLEFKEGYEVNKHKQGIGFNEKKGRF